MTKRLGRGLADLIDSTAARTESFMMLRTDQISAGRFQPRTAISDVGLEELKESIRRKGVIEPVIVREAAEGTYELVAGERRLRASQQLGITEVPAMVKTLSDKEALELSLVENIQRENLNPLEEAKGYTRLLDEFGYTQEDIASAVGKDRTTIANLLRLLSLPDEIRKGLGDGVITMGHAKALLSVQDQARQIELYRRAKQDGLSVRETEALAGTWSELRKRRARRVDPQGRAIEVQLEQLLGTKVRIATRRKGGRLIIEYFSQEDLTRILAVLGTSTS